MIPLSIPVLYGNEWKYVKECLDSGWVSSAGKFVEIFEQKICAYTRARYATACINGTAGLLVGLRIAGVESGDEVIVPTVTFIAPVNAVKYLNAEPVFMDCDDYLNMDVEKLEEFCKECCCMSSNGLRNKKTRRLIKAIIPVHIFGNPCDMQAIMGVARKYGLKVIEDATESLGSFFFAGKYANRFTGTIGDMGVYSFNGNKIITTGGGGMIVTDNPLFARKAKYLTTQAKDDALSYIHNEVGYNFRLTNILAALGVAQLETIEQRIERKKSNYRLYYDGLRGIDGLGLMGIPDKTRPNYWFYSLLVEKTRYGSSRQELLSFMLRNKIEVRPLWYLNHRQKPFRKNQTYKMKKAEWFWERILNLPCSIDLTEGQIGKIVTLLKKKVS